jgi:adenylate kinase
LFAKSSKGVKRVVLITGTPCVGKTSVARLLSSRLNAILVNLTELALHENLISGVNGELDSIIVDEVRLRRKISVVIEKSDRDVVVDGHYAVHVVPKRFVSHVFVLRRDPVELRGFMEKAGFSGRKLWENLAAEILDVCLFDAIKVYGKDVVCELNVTGKSQEEVVKEILGAINERVKCRVGVVDWLGKLEIEGLLDEYLRI